MAFEEAQRLLAEHRAKAEQIEAEEARANGFSTYEEYWESRVEASRMEQLERDKELEKRAIQMGMTLEQLELKMEMEDPQRWVPRGWNLMARPPPCDCEGMTTCIIRLSSSYIAQIISTKPSVQRRWSPLPLKTVGS